MRRELGITRHFCELRVYLKNSNTRILLAKTKTVFESKLVKYFESDLVKLCLDVNTKLIIIVGLWLDNNTYSTSFRQHD